MIRVNRVSGRDLIREDWEQAMYIALGLSLSVWDIYIDEERACLIGLSPPTLLSDHAYIWMRHFPEVVDKHRFLMVRHSQIVVEELLEKYSVLIGHCVMEADVNKTMRWLKWLGAEFGDYDGGKIPFQIRRKGG